MITTYQYYLEQKKMGNIIDNGLIFNEIDFEYYYCYELINKCATCYYPAREKTDKQRQ